MDNFESFFKTEPPQALTDRILREAQAELAGNKKRQIKKKIILFFVPAATALAASLFIFHLQLNTHNLFPGVSEVQEVPYAVLPAPEFLVQFADGDDAIDMVNDLGLLEQMDNLELISDEDLAG